jgi:hypothetical protein
VISYVDPDDVIKTNRLGKAVQSETELSSALEEILSGPYSEPRHIQDYYVRNHSIKTIDKYCTVLEEIHNNS